MVTLKIGTTGDPENRIDKTANFPFVLSGTFKEDVSVIDPVIVVESSTNLTTYNYAYIEELSRYYYIRDIIVKTTNLYELHLHVDVLKTYASGIIAAPCIISKSANRYNLYLNDTNYKCYQNNHIVVKNFPAGFPIEDSRFVVTVLGDKEWSE